MEIDAEQVDIRPTETAIDLSSHRERDYMGDEALYVEFKYRPKYSKAKGKHLQVLYTHIHCPGKSRKEIVRPKEDEDEIRFHRQWKAFQNDEERPAGGVPVEELPFLDEAMVANLHGLKIYTAEQILAMSDNTIQALAPAGRTILEKTEAYMDSQKGGTMIDELVEKNRELLSSRAEDQERMAEMESQLAELKGIIAQANPKNAPAARSTKEKAKELEKG